jgi:hypothetical protein
MGYISPPPSSSSSFSSSSFYFSLGVPPAKARAIGSVF